MIVTTAGSDDFARSLAQAAGAGFLPLEHKIFPNQESYFRIPLFDDEKVVFVGRASSPVSPDKLIVEAMLACSELKRRGKRVCCVMPYMPYGKQDKVFLEGEAASLLLLRESLLTACDVLVSVSSHDARGGGWVVKGKVYDVDGSAPAAGFLKGLNLHDPVLVAPDGKAAPMAQGLGLEWEIVPLKKERLDSSTCKTCAPEGLSLKGKTAVMFDDMVSTGGTLAEAAAVCRKAGASRVVCAAVHPVLAPGCEERLKKAGAELCCSDTISSPVSRFSAADEVAAALLKIF